MSTNRALAPAGEMIGAVIRKPAPTVFVRDSWMSDPMKEVLNYDPRSELGKAVKRMLKLVPNTEEARFMVAEVIDRLSSCVIVESALYATVKRGALWLANMRGPAFEDLGLVGTKVVTTAGVGYIVDSFQGLVEPELMRFHGLGTGSGAEAASDTALGTELTTEYNPNSTRATGTLTESAANIFTTVGSNTLDGTPGAALREHGIFNLNAGGVLLDRTVFAAVTLSSGDTFSSSYSLTFSSGG